MTILSVRITPEGAWINDQRVPVEIGPKGLLASIYKSREMNYPKFYKMDPLAKLGFIASELLLDEEAKRFGTERFVEREDRAIVLVNHSASLAADQAYETTIQPGPNYFPSPADFVYTLPNIVTGEIAIRNQYFGETLFLCIDEKDQLQIDSLVSSVFADPMTRSALGGWLECTSADNFVAELFLIANH